MDRLEESVLVGRQVAVEIVVEETLFAMLERADDRAALARRISTRAKHAAAVASKDKIGQYSVALQDTVSTICANLQARLAGCQPGAGQHRRR